MATYKTGSVSKTYGDLTGDNDYKFRIGSLSPMPKIPAGAKLDSLKYDCKARRNWGATGNNGRVDVDAGGTWINVISGMGYNSDYDPGPVELQPYTFTYADGTILFQNGSDELHIEVEHNASWLVGKSWWTISANVITAYYSLPVYTVSVSVFGGIGGSIQLGGGDYDINATATLAADTDEGYGFVGWANQSGTVIATQNPYYFTVTADTTLYAVFEPITHTVTFKDDNGATLHTTTVNHGSTVTPPTSPTKADTAQWKYTFDGWYDSNGNKWTSSTTITGAVTYTARYSSSVQKYTVRWFNEDGSLLETDTDVPYGTKPDYNGATPTRPGNAEHSYQFAGWNYDTENGITPALGTVYIDITAEFTEIDNTYTVQWVNEGKVIETDTLVPYGAKPDYNGATPTKASDAQYDYTFIGWSTSVTEPAKPETELETVKGNVTYTAVYSATVKFYAVRVILFNTESTQVVEYGRDIVLEAPAVVDFHQFVKWADGNTDNPRTVEVTGEATYQAVYERIPIPFKTNLEQVTGVYIVPDASKPGTGTIVYVINGVVPTVLNDGRTVDGYSFVVSNSVPNNGYSLKKLFVNNTRIW